MKHPATTYLVTGGTGFIGMNIVNRLLEIPNAMVEVTFKTPRTYFYNDILHHPRVVPLHLDLTEKANCLHATEAVDVVIMAGAVSFGAKFIQNNPLGLVNDNIIMNVNMLDACRENGVQKVIYFGSTTGYPDGDA